MSLTNSFNHFLYKVITLAFTTLFGVYSVTGGICKEPAEVPEDFTPVLRFAVCSDIHLDGKEDQVNAERFAEMFNECYAYSENHKNYKKLDAVMVCGDMTDWGREEEYKTYYRRAVSNGYDGRKIKNYLAQMELEAE